MPNDTDGTTATTDPRALLTHCHRCRAEATAEGTSDNDNDSEEVTTTTCEGCSGTFPANDTRTADYAGVTYHWCSDCYRQNYRTCRDCGIDYRNSETWETLDGEGHVCHSCIAEDSYRYFTCCDAYGTDDDGLTDSSGDSICHDCLNSDEYFLCSNCLNHHRDSDRAYDDAADVWTALCTWCYNREQRSRPRAGHIHDYSFKPDPKFHGGGKGHMGLEWETDCYDDLTKATKKLGKIDPKEENYYLKSDGTLDHGVEIVWNPRSMHDWMENRNLLAKVARAVKAYGGKSFDSGNCGIHIHRDRSDLNDIAISNLILLLVKLKKKVVKVAQRHSRNYASFDFYANQTGRDTKLIYKAVKNGRMTGERYVALNLRNPNTVEFRIFKGTLKVDTLMSYLLFCHYLTEYAKSQSYSRLYRTHQNKIWTEFKTYLGEQGKNAKRLLNYINSKVYRKPNGSGRKGS